MSCRSCGQRPRRSFIPASLPEYPESTRLLSAPTLTPDGWQSTCTKCGVRTEPSPFKEQLAAACKCTTDQ